MVGSGPTNGEDGALLLRNILQAMKDIKNKEVNNINDLNNKLMGKYYQMTAPLFYKIKVADQIIGIHKTLDLFTTLDELKEDEFTYFLIKKFLTYYNEDKYHKVAKSIIEKIYILAGKNKEKCISFLNSLINSKNKNDATSRGISFLENYFLYLGKRKTEKQLYKLCQSFVSKWTIC